MLWLLTTEAQGKPLDRDPTPHEHGTDAPGNYNREDMDNFKNVEHENHTTLRPLTRNLDDLWHRVETVKGPTYGSYKSRGAWAS